MENEKVAYSFGCLVAKDLMGQADALGLNVEDIKNGFTAAIDGSEKEDIYSMQEVQQFFQAAQTKMQEAQQKAQGEKTKENKGVIDAFLAKVESDEGIEKTESGIIYEIIEEGDGEQPSSAEAVVKVHYEGSLKDATIFDSSIVRGEPIDFPLNRVIKGWTEGVQLMKTGAKYRFLIPSELAYGEAGSPPVIPANTDLIFLVELIEILK